MSSARSKVPVFAHVCLHTSFQLSTMLLSAECSWDIKTKKTPRPNVTSCSECILARKLRLRVIWGEKIQEITVMSGCQILDECFFSRSPLFFEAVWWRTSFLLLSLWSYTLRRCSFTALLPPAGFKWPTLHTAWQQLIRLSFPPGGPHCAMKLVKAFPLVKVGFSIRTIVPFTPMCSYINAAAAWCWQKQKATCGEY